ncbi:MAG: rhomboid family intramembrane serine protease [Lachnospiraceae bacterium]|nr:rhomboid family intramembrane serine protease [Lachnospiraceae bacterium]MCI9107144.1 rhomboid family intramembrane serine protease [Lachnospiraceae bacterium]MCI9342874.1 rhomboid family intramembrane serine protease [Lachnospiraceae bacterium]
MSNFEKKFGKYAIKNLSLTLIMCYAAGYLIEMVLPGLFYFLTLNPYAIIHGQVWRLVTWILIPPDSSNLFFVLLMLYFYYSLGTSLERTWGTYRYNVYIFSGMLFTIIGSFLMMGYCYLVRPADMVAYGPSVFFSAVSPLFSTYYVNMSIFLAFAATFPEVQVLLMFIIPIKVKVLGIIYGVMLIANFIQGSAYSRFAMAASLFNFVVFWITSKNHIHMSPKQVKRRQEYRREVKRNTGVTKHKCAICGRTELDSPDLEFRFCSKCNGNYEYCQEHLFTHQHVK